MGKYEEALERAKQGLPIDEVFPELKESEDERIRKIIRLALIASEDELSDFYKVHNIHRKECTDWLEKKKEQKPSTEETELNSIAFLEQMGYTCVPPGAKPAELPKSEDYGIDGLYAAIDILQKTLGEVDGYQTDDGILEHECAISAVKELYEQKPAEWSEESDMNKTLRLLEALAEDSENDYCPYNADTLRKTISWLKSLPTRFSLQPHWKPSEEQIYSLGTVVKGAGENSAGSIAYNLKELYEDLKKL